MTTVFIDTNQLNAIVVRRLTACVLPGVYALLASDPRHLDAVRQRWGFDARGAAAYQRRLRTSAGAPDFGPWFDTLTDAGGNTRTVLSEYRDGALHVTLNPFAGIKTDAVLNESTRRPALRT